jgi:hypothetical protein
MVHRACLGLAAFLLAALASEPACAQERYGMPISPHHDVRGLWPAPVPSLAIDDIPRFVTEFVPAGGPILRFTSRPGAWYALVHVPLLAALPAQLWLWMPADAHDVRVTVLDRPPGAGPTAGIPLPLRAARGGARVALQSVPFVIPSDGAAAGAFVLVEQSRGANARPLPVWMQLRSMEGEYWSGSTYGYGPHFDGIGAGRHDPVPLSPLQTPRYYSGGLLELPFGVRPQSPENPRPHANEGRN